jgi:hypothetical protein
MKNYFRLPILIIGIAGLWFISLKVVCLKCQKGVPTQEFDYKSPARLDTCVRLYWEFPNFQFYLKEITMGGDKIDAFSTVHLNSMDADFYLFSSHKYLYELGVEPKRLYGNIWSFPYSTGGKDTKSEGLEIFRITDSTVVYIGRVSGWKDINGDGLSELFIYEVIEYGIAEAFNKWGAFIVELSGDSLINKFDEGY